MQHSDKDASLGFRETFDNYYDDAPSLSEKLLLPHLAKGNDVYIATAFSTGYIFNTVRQLAELSGDDLDHHGLLRIVFFVQGDLSIKSLGVNRFRTYLAKHAESDLQVAQFIFDALALIDDQKLRIGIAHTSQKSPLIRSCFGIVRPYEDSSSEAATDYAALVDSKPGDFNSPVKPLLSWRPDDFLPAQEILAKVHSLFYNTQKNSWLVSDQESLSWLEYLAEWYESNPPKMAPTVTTLSDEDFDDEEDIDVDEELKKFLATFPELANDDDYDWFDNQDESFAFDIRKHISSWVTVGHSELKFGHIPPVGIYYREMYGPVGAECPCGEVILRAYGCPSIDWDYEPEAY